MFVFSWLIVFFHNCNNVNLKISCPWSLYGCIGTDQLSRDIVYFLNFSVTMFYYAGQWSINYYPIIIIDIIIILYSVLEKKLCFICIYWSRSDYCVCLILSSLRKSSPKLIWKGPGNWMMRNGTGLEQRYRKTLIIADIVQMMMSKSFTRFSCKFHRTKTMKRFQRSAKAKKNIDETEQYTSQSLNCLLSNEV